MLTDLLDMGLAAGDLVSSLLEVSCLSFARELPGRDLVDFEFFRARLRAGRGYKLMIPAVAAIVGRTILGSLNTDSLKGLLVMLRDWYAALAPTSCMTPRHR